MELRVCRAAGGQAPREALGLLVPLVAACASEGIRRDTGVVSWLHWPNLVTFEGRALAEASLSVSPPRKQGGDLELVFGISVNCFADIQHGPPSKLRETSILQVLGVEVDPGMLRDRILQALDWYYAEWERGAYQKLVERMRPTVAWLGRDVEVRGSEGRVLRGRALGLDERGSLLLDPRRGVAKRSALALRPESVELVREAS